MKFLMLAGMAAFALAATAASNPAISADQGSSETLKSSVSLRGAVLDSVTAAGVSCAVVVVRQSGVSGERIVPVDANGRYEMGGLAQAAATVNVYAPRYAGQSKTITLAPGDNSLSFDLSSESLSGGITGLCSDALADQPLAGIRVDVYRAGDVFTTYTGSCGVYSVNSLAAVSAALVTVVYTSPAYETVIVPVMVEPGGAAIVDYSLYPKFAAPGSVAGVVTNSSTGVPLAGARVTVNGAGIVSVTSDASGVYAVNALPEGVLTVEASATGYDSRSQVVTISSLGTTAVDFALRPANSALLGDVDGDNAVTALDIQYVTNTDLGILGGYDCDLNRDNIVNAADIQLVINSALGRGKSD